mgnify:CR=1 FL=1
MEATGMSPTETLWMVFDIMYAHVEACGRAWAREHLGPIWGERRPLRRG